jgi:tetratricopeptide (TPR) repeat protein
MVGTVELAATPFFPQQRMQCGPAALATVLTASQASVTPAQLEPLVYLPGRRGSLQIEMLATPRNFGRIAYRIEPELAAIVSELTIGRPVLVLHNYGLPLWPRWHYAVVIGYDGSRDQLVMRSGRTQRQVWSARHFMRAWDNGGRWAFVILRPGEMPTHVNMKRYLDAAAAFERVAAPQDAFLAFDGAVNAWPEEPLAWIGRGTARYRQQLFDQAAADYRAALALNPGNPGARNNLAMALLGLGCPRAARKEVEAIDLATLEERLHIAVQDTQQQVGKHAASADAAHCAATH